MLDDADTGWQYGADFVRKVNAGGCMGMVSDNPTMQAREVRRADLTTQAIEILAVLEEENGTASQRAVARRVGLSLGTINQVIRRLIDEGYINAQAENGRTVIYSLSRAGQNALESSRRESITQVVGQYAAFVDTLQVTIERFIQDGINNIYIQGEGPLRSCVEHAVSKCDHARLVGTSDSSADTAIFNVGASAVAVGAPAAVVNVVHELMGGTHV